MSQNGMATAGESFKMKSLLSQVKMSSWNKVSRVWDFKKKGEILVVTVLGFFGFFFSLFLPYFLKITITITITIYIYIYKNIYKHLVSLLT